MADLTLATAVYTNYCEMWRRVGPLAPSGSVFEVIEREDMLLIRSHFAHRVPHMVLAPRVLDEDAPRWTRALVDELTRDPVSLVVRIPPGEEGGTLVQALLAEGFMRAVRPDLAMARAAPSPDTEPDTDITLVEGGHDLEEARALLARVFGLPSEVFAYYTPPEVVRTYVLRHGGAPVAAACLSPSPDAAGIYSVGVLPSMRGQGFARRLILHAMRDAALLGYATVVLSCEHYLAPLYRQLGFAPCWELISYWLETWWR